MANQTIYLLMRSNGEAWEDYQEWVVKAFLNKRDAFNHAVKLGWEPTGKWDSMEFQIRQPEWKGYYPYIASGWIEELQLEVPLIIKEVWQVERRKNESANS